MCLLLRPPPPPSPAGICYSVRYYTYIIIIIYTYCTRTRLLLYASVYKRAQGRAADTAQRVWGIRPFRHCSACPEQTGAGNVYRNHECTRNSRQVPFTPRWEKPAETLIIRFLSCYSLRRRVLEGWPAGGWDEGVTTRYVTYRSRFFFLYDTPI